MYNIKGNSYAPVLLILLLLNLFLGIDNTYADSWALKSNVSILSREYCASFSINDKGYISCGVDGDLNIYNDLWEYNSILDSWTQKSSLPSNTRYALVGFSVDTFGYIFGGLDDLDNSLNDLWRYNPAANSWTVMSNSPLPRANAAAFILGQNVYIGLGADNVSLGIFSNSWSKYSITSNSWSNIPSFPGPARWASCAMSLLGKGYVGCGSDGNNFYKDWYEYDTLSSSWIFKSNTPFSNRAGAFSFALNDFGYIGTGSGINGDTVDLWQYNSNTDSWIQKRSFAGGKRDGCYSFVLGNYGFVGGGFDGDSTDFNDLWQYNPDSILLINENEVAISYEISPNPSSGIFYISCMVNFNATIFINDCFGKCIYSKLIDNFTEINLSNFPNGIYFAHIYKNGYRYLKKIILN